MFCFDGINKFCWWLLAENIEWIFIVGFKFPIWQNYNKSLFSFTWKMTIIYQVSTVFFPTKFSVEFQKFPVLSHREKPKRLLLFLWFLDLKNTKTIWKNCLQKTTLLSVFLIFVATINWKRLSRSLLRIRLRSEDFWFNWIR